MDYMENNLILNTYYKRAVYMSNSFVFFFYLLRADRKLQNYQNLQSRILLLIFFRYKRKKERSEIARQKFLNPSLSILSYLKMSTWLFHKTKTKNSLFFAFTISSYFSPNNELGHAESCILYLGHRRPCPQFFNKSPLYILLANPGFTHSHITVGWKDQALLVGRQVAEIHWVDESIAKLSHYL